MSNEDVLWPMAVIEGIRSLDIELSSPIQQWSSIYNWMEFYSFIAELNLLKKNNKKKNFLFFD